MCHMISMAQLQLCNRFTAAKKLNMFAVGEEKAVSRRVLKRYGKNDRSSAFNAVVFTTD